MSARILTALTVLLAAPACQASHEPRLHSMERPSLGLMTSLPIYWQEAADFQSLLSSDTPRGWARTALERDRELVPLDTLDAVALSRLKAVLLAQPRPLSAAENVALDEWVRGGGRLLLFADPLLTVHSSYPVGDVRRPQDVALLSPILRHWGLELLLHDDEPAGERLVESGGVAIPVENAGRFRPLPGSPCTLDAEGVLAECRIGKGRAVILADAAILDESESGSSQSRRDALDMLLDRAFD